MGFSASAELENEFSDLLLPKFAMISLVIRMASSSLTAK